MTDAPTDSCYGLPPGLPVPVDDGACDHLTGMSVPSLELRATTGDLVDLTDLGATLAVLYVYPRTGDPGSAPPPASWDAIPGARGCTPQSCAFRDRHTELVALDATIAGLSAQRPDEQAAFAAHERLPFALLSDPELRVGAALGLPAFEFGGRRLYRRVTLVLERGIITRVFYPVFPPDLNAAEVLDWLHSRRVP